MRWIADFWSTDWKTASCVMLPAASVSRHGLVTPVLSGLLDTISAVRRNSAISAGFSAGAVTAACRAPTLPAAASQTIHRITAAVDRRRRVGFMENLQL